ncbi:MAG TPA: nodulation protein NfeD [Spirochaetia bacterium]|nr:nodulation protein NfeD [Spirochaetia bacterium]
MKPVRFCFVLLFIFLTAAAFSQDRAAAVLTLDGPIDPVSARYLLRGLQRAQRDGAALVVIQVDTPGGLGTSMDQIVQAILASPVPIVVYVSPQGARAASAGVFVAMAASVAAMAPGTHIGAAHPVDASGADIPGAMGEKVLNDAVAQLKSLAQLRGRDPAWPDEAVRQSQSITADQAVSEHVADLQAASLSDLLAALDGRVVPTAQGAVTLRTTGIEVHRSPMTFIDRFLGVLINPDLAYILLVIGIFGLIFEFSFPGMIAPGVAGALALVLAFLSFGNLPTNIGGLVFIVLSVVLFVVDIKAPTHGVLTAGGVVAFVLGSLLLFPPWRTPTLPTLPVVHVSPVVIAVMTFLVVLFFAVVLAQGVRAQERQVSFGEETIVGMVGRAASELGPDGYVQAGGEQWSARSAEGAIRAGELVEVVGREGLKLVVRRGPTGPAKDTGKEAVV